MSDSEVVLLHATEQQRLPAVVSGHGSGASDSDGKNMTLNQPAFLDVLDSDRFDREMVIPDTYKGLLPGPLLPIKDFLDRPCVSQTHGFLLRDPGLAFSEKPPISNITLIFKRAIPSDSYVSKLYDTAQKHWSLGANSVTDGHYPESPYPLWAITFWRESHNIIRRTREYKETCTFLEKAIGKTKSSHLLHREELVSKLESARANFLELPWNSPISMLGYSFDTARTSLFSDVLSERWLSDDVLNLAIEHLKHRLRNTHTNSRQGTLDVLIEDVNFGNAIRFNCAAYFAKFRDRLKASGRQPKFIYFPAFLDFGHWIAIRISLQDRVISYGMKITFDSQLTLILVQVTLFRDDLLVHQRVC
jgi:hypothetical protein